MAGTGTRHLDIRFADGLHAKTHSEAWRSLQASAAESRAFAARGTGMSLPLPIDYAPMEADTAREIPTGPEWEYEPKWDGFRCLAFRDGGSIHIMSKSGQPLARYFPEITAALVSLPAKKFVLDGELIVTQQRTLDFDALLQRIHPAESR